MSFVNLPTDVTIGSIVVLVLVLGFWTFLAWLRQRNLTAATKAAIEGTDEKQCERAERIVKMMVEADVKRRRWYHFGRDDPPGRHRA